MDVNCPKRQYGELKKVSLAYEEGFFQPDKRVQICFFLVGSADPEFLVVSSTTKGTRQPTPPEEAAGWGHVESLGHGSVHLLSFEGFVVQIPNARAASKRLLAAR